MSGILLVFYWHMTSVSFKSWVSYWVADVHLKSLCLESTASGRWHTWGSTWRWQWRLTHPTRPQLGPAKNGGKRWPSFTFLCAEKKCTRMNCLTHFGIHCTSNARICPSPQTTAGLRVCSVFVVQTPHSLKMSHITCIQSFYIVTHADHIMHIKSNMHLGQANVHTKKDNHTSGRIFNNNNEFLCVQRHKIMMFLSDLSAAAAYRQWKHLPFSSWGSQGAITVPGARVRWPLCIHICTVLLNVRWLEF